METRFTPQEFNQQVVEFRKMFGSKDFWAKSVEQRDIAVKALGFCYMHMELNTPQNEITRCAELLDQTLTEYSRRELMLISMGKL